MCVFCKIVNGEIPSYKIYEDDDILAFLDISQATKGHTLVIPKKHYDNLLTIDSKTLEKVSVACQKVATTLKEKLNTSNFNFVNNCGTTAGQSVMHVHFHVIPRYPDDDFKMNITEHAPDFDALKTLHELITK